MSVAMFVVLVAFGQLMELLVCTLSILLEFWQYQNLGAFNLESAIFDVNQNRCQAVWLFTHVFPKTPHLVHRYVLLSINVVVSINVVEARYWYNFHLLLVPILVFVHFPF
jgi:hypothetical protein